MIVGVLSLASGPLRADDPPLVAAGPAENPYELVMRQPLSRETWPSWRELYLQRYFVDDEELSRDFHKRLHAFLREQAHAGGDALPTELEGDPIAWLVLAGSYTLGSNEAKPTDRDYALAEEASRKAIALGDPQAIGSFRLAANLVFRAHREQAGTSPAPDVEKRLVEAERLLEVVERVSPRANTVLWRGLIAEIRGDTRGALNLFRKATETHPQSAASAVRYLSRVLAAVEPVENPDALTGLFAERFPRDGRVQAFHAIALYRANRFQEAAEAMDRARSLEPRIADLMGQEAVETIEESRTLAPKTVAGLTAIASNQYDDAIRLLREARAERPDSLPAARGLALALGHQLGVRTGSFDGAAAEAVEREVGGLCRRFPNDSAMKAAHALTLAGSARFVDAEQALERVQQLGGDPAQFFDAGSLARIHKAAEDQKRGFRMPFRPRGQNPALDPAAEEARRFWLNAALVGCAAALAWIAAMFVMGVVLAVAIPRVPGPDTLTGQVRGRREVWLERFYLVVLGLGLLGFYASVPIVAIGLLAVTLGLFLLLLVCRVIHFGVLQRGLWATGNVLRCALMGPSREVLGIEATAETHPRLLEAINAVAERVRTRPVDAVYLTPSSSISVRQEGSGPFGLLGQRRRVLELGVSTLPLLTGDEFKAILAHEYGHFSHNDPFYNRFLFQVSSSLATSLAVMNAAGGVLNYLNPFHWFWWLYLRAYALLANGFSRSREFLADRRAVSAYGKHAFVSGLSKVSVDGVLFEATVYREIQRLLRQGQSFSNAFAAFRDFREGTEKDTTREKLLDDVKKRKPRWLDTHPTYSERVAAVADFPAASEAGDTAPAVDLLNDSEAVETELTKMLTGYLYHLSSGMHGS